MKRWVRLAFTGSLLALMLGAWSSPAWAAVPATGFDADLEEDGDIQFCNPGKVENRNYLQAIVNLNRETRVLPGADPRFVDVTGTGQFCEASVEKFNNKASGANYAQWVYRLHPDRLQINVNARRYPSLPEGQQLATVTHEMEHGAGLSHPPEKRYWCRTSVVSSYAGCRAIGEKRRLTPGPEDVESFRVYWDRLSGGDGPYPVRNKCWDERDANNDGTCDRYGQPNQVGSAASRTGPAPMPAPATVE